jgi:hypothetical protein
VGVVPVTNPPVVAVLPPAAAAVVVAADDPPPLPPPPLPAPQTLLYALRTPVGRGISGQKDL